MRTRKNKEKKQNEQNSRALQKWPKLQKRENNMKCPKKEGKKKKKTEQQANHQDILSQKRKQGKKADRKNKELCGTVNFSCENSAQQNSAKLEMTK